MDPYAIIARYYPPRSRARDILERHGRAVARKALAAADRVAHLKPDRDLIHDAALLHDIGIFLTSSPDLGCFGTRPYLCHGVLGREILDAHGFPVHALICERHVGAGISKEDVVSNGFPLPQRDMIPVTLEEKIVCYADKFFSKSGGGEENEKPVEEIIGELAGYGPEKARLFQQWHEAFG